MCGERNCEKTYHPRTMCVFSCPAERNEQTALAIPSGLRGEHASERGKRAREM